MGLADILKQNCKPYRWKRRPEVLLCPSIPQPLHEVNPRTILGSKWWNETREAAYKTTDYHCLACGVPKYAARGRQWLEGHELYTIDWLRGTSIYIETVPLCHFCHNFVHQGRMDAMVRLGKMVLRKKLDVLEHGAEVLHAAGLPAVREPYSGPFAPWASWRLVIGKRKFKPKFKSLKEWEKYHDAETQAESD